jgi:hypothetical protein
MDANQICEDKVAWGKKLLLIFMWVTDDELQLFMMHPEFVCWDITSQTNQEKHDFMAVSGKDGNGKLFSFCSCLHSITEMVGFQSFL